MQVTPTPMSVSCAIAQAPFCAVTAAQQPTIFAALGSPTKACHKGSGSVQSVPSAAEVNAAARLTCHKAIPPFVQPSI